MGVNPTQRSVRQADESLGFLTLLGEFQDNEKKYQYLGNKIVPWFPYVPAPKHTQIHISIYPTIRIIQ